jgi:myo-inositol 2-dehydrogenase/D-chiro-inositol 1-dehydrogenase
MSAGKLKTAVLGLNNAGELLLQAASESDHFQIQAVADTDPKHAEKLAAQYGCAGYDDYRQLVIQNELDCLLVAAGIYSCDEHIRLAMKKKFNVLKLAPAARNFEEAAEFVQLAEDEGVQFAIGNLLRFAESFRALHEFVRQGRIEQVFLATAFCNAGNEMGPAWYTDPKLAGGGVLLRNCYELIDQIVWNFSVPQQVYALSSSQAADKQQRLYLSEDTAAVMMKFSDTLVGNLVAFRRAGIEPAEASVRIYGRAEILTVSNTEFTVSDGQGRISEQSRYEYEPLCCTARLLENFALSLLSPDKNRLCSTGRENLDNMAAIEAAYLSARTGFPEEPGRIMQMAPRRPGTPTGTQPPHG